MQVDLVATNKTRNKEVHATLNGKHTACRISLTKAENIGHFTSIGQMKDISQITCEKCKNSVAKQLIRESNKEMKAMLKEEQKMMKRDASESRPQKKEEPARNASPIQAPAPHTSAANSDGGYVPPAMRKMQQAAAAASSVPEPEAPAPIPAPPQMPTPHGNDVLSQFNIPNIPTLAQSATATASVHNPVPTLNETDDVLSQFSVPPLPAESQPFSTSAPTPAPTPTVGGMADSAEDVLAQFNIPSVPSQPVVTPPPVSVPPVSGIVDSAEDVLAQFNIPPVPSQPQSAPTPPPAPVPPVSGVADSAEDVLAQFNIPPVPSQPQKPSEAEDVLAQFSIPAGAQSAVTVNVPGGDVESVPVQVEKPATDPDDILAQFSMASKGTEGAFENVANDLFGAGAPKVEAPQSDVLNAQLANEPTDEEADSFGELAAEIAASKSDVVEVDVEPAPDDYDPFDRPVVPIPDNPADAFARPAMDLPTSPYAKPAEQPVAELPTNPYATPAEPITELPTNPYEKPAAPVAEEPVNPFVRPVPPEPASMFSRPAASAPRTIIDDISDAADLFVMPGQSKDTPIEVSNVMTAQPQASEELPNIANVPTAATALPDSPELVSVPTSLPQQQMPYGQPMMQQPMMQQPMMQQPMMQQPMGYPQQPYPQMPYGQPMMQQPFAMPQFQQPYINPYMNQQVNLYAVPKAVEPRKPNAPTPLFVGYSADGRQLFQTYDELGKPIPINEPVYSAPPQQPENPFTAAAKGVGITPGLQQGGAPVLDVEELMAAMGIEDPSKKKQENEKEIVFTEFKMPDKKKKAHQAAEKVAQPAPAETGPISAAEAKRRKKLDRINKEFERQLKMLEEQGLDPSTGAFVGRKK